MSEPQAGSDLAGVRTRALRSGDGFVVSGHKIWTSLAHHADYIYLLARTDPDSTRHEGLSELIVPLASGDRLACYRSRSLQPMALCRSDQRRDQRFLL